ncbi:MAG: hypothetical protein HPY54_14550 [Chthonomonadetes bacterium]|nr:hypothetical protein [Chthonomonadetes bacterium]
MSAYIDQLAWAPDSREVAVVGGEFIWLLSVADKQASTLRKTRRAEYYGGTIVLVPPLLVNVSHVGLGLMRVNGSQQTRHLAVGSVMKCSVAPKGTKVVGLLMPVKGGDKAATLCVGRLSMSGFHQLRQIRRGAIVDFCWDPSGRQVVYLTDTGKVETVAVW